MSKKKLLINQVKVASVQDRNTIPTRIQYEGKSYKIGHDVQQSSPSRGKIIENFKVELGRQSREQLISSKKTVAKGHTRTFMGVAKDYLESLCDEIEADLKRYGQPLPDKVLVAEPISIEEEGKVSGQWLSNYRFAVTRALHSKFDEIDFLPEPFAVFQYYRYGLRHPLLSEQSQHIALVLDFGGGTFDVSIIETTKEGDISQGGRASRPLAAKSIPVGGFFINQKIAESLLFSALPDRKSKTTSRAALKTIGDFSSLSIIDNDNLPTEYANFARHFQNLLNEVEAAKINICNSIKNWDLTPNLVHRVRHIVNVPQSPFSESGEIAEISVSADDIREVFIRDVWSARLKEAITKAIKRAQEEIKGKPISVVLLSGGSTNIGWTRSLFERDLSSLLGDASILEISENYQEVVAKGLAVECARQFYTEGDGDFGAVTYNRLNLVLRTDKESPKVYSYRPRSPGLSHPESDGVLLPSAASLRAYEGEKIVWKARLSSAPSHSLSYYYMKSSFDPDDLESLHNVAANRVFIKNRVYGQGIDVELEVGPDGSAHPSFLLNRGKGDREERVFGEPFYLDMTHAGQVAPQESYLGLDFGTATSAASAVFQSDIKAYKDRSKEKSWLELSDLIEILPYPVAHPLAQYVSQTDRRLLETTWKTAIESMLTFAAYIAFADVSATHGNRSIVFPANFNRSAGPLLDLLSKLRPIEVSGTLVAKALLPLLGDESLSNLRDIVSAVNDIKHDRQPSIDFNQSLTHVGNVIKAAIGTSQFGSFETTQKKSFGPGYTGIFRSFCGANPPFIELSNYSGNFDFNCVDVFLADISSGRVLPLSPLYYAFSPREFDLSGDCPLYLLDSVQANFEDFRYIPVKRGDGVSVSGHETLGDVKWIASEHLKGGGYPKIQNGTKFTRR
jgi:molecular chaperone DnaK (HSP70)